jgi:hypothetical protein
VNPGATHRRAGSPAPARSLYLASHSAACAPAPNRFPPCPSSPMFAIPVRAAGQVVGGIPGLAAPDRHAPGSASQANPSDSCLEYL